MNATYRRRAAVSAGVMVVSAMLAACGADKPNESPKESAGAGIAVPKEFEGKTLVVVADASYAPNEFLDEDGKTVVGTGADLAKAIGDELGLEVSVQNVPFDSIIPGIAAGKFSVGMSSFTDTKDREQVVDFVTYLTAGSSFYVRSDGGPQIETIADLCAQKVAVEKGTIQANEVAKQAKTCKIDLQVFPDQGAVNLALRSGRASVAVADSPVAAYAVKQSDGLLELSGESYDNAPYGIAVAKDSGLAHPILAAVKKLIANGRYEKILSTWGVQDGAIAEPVINGATS